LTCGDCRRRLRIAGASGTNLGPIWDHTAHAQCSAEQTEELVGVQLRLNPGQPAPELLAHFRREPTAGARARVRTRREVSDAGGTMTSMEAAGDEDGRDSATSWTNPWIGAASRAAFSASLACCAALTFGFAREQQAQARARSPTRRPPLLLRLSQPLQWV
jgi:hypothetical protein